MSASMIARLVASPSTSAGREYAWASGPLLPSAISFAVIAATTSPFSACTSGRAPSSAQREKEANISSSFTISAPL
ncbi:hypothetical protein D3C87_2018250 [compost metagenome]